MRELPKQRILRVVGGGMVIGDGGGIGYGVWDDGRGWKGNGLVIYCVEGGSVGNH